MDLIWTCPCCGKRYDTLSFAYALDEPDPWGAVPGDEREYRGVLGSDTCRIDEQFYIRGRIVVPVIGSDDPFIWGTWASVSKESFARFGALWDVEKREQEPPFAAHDQQRHPDLSEDLWPPMQGHDEEHTQASFIRA